MTRDKVELSTIGIYIRTVSLDHSYKDNKELAELIQDTFGVICTREDVDNYQMHFEMENYEKYNEDLVHV